MKFDPPGDFRTNNFDLLRIGAALQVAILHGAEHLHVDLGFLGYILGMFPGVPIFFAISGFLIAGAWERAPYLPQYALNRALRIFPALWVCLAFSIAMSALVGGINFATPAALPWIAAQVSAGQFYNPEFLRGFGTGVLNGSLWTIPVELQFYVALPLGLTLISMLGKSQELRGALILGLTAAAAVLAIGFRATLMSRSPELLKWLDITLLPHLYMFLVGVTIYFHQEFVRRYLARRALLWLMLFFVVAVALRSTGWLALWGAANPLFTALLALLTISAAFTRTGAVKVLRGYDISYGVYIYHMVVVNVLVQLGTSGVGPLLAGLALTVLLAAASWHFVERPALRMKRPPAIRQRSAQGI